MAKEILTKIEIDEVAVCPQGIDPGADMVFFKAHGEKPSQQRIRMGVSFEKAHDEDPRLFDEVIEEWNSVGISDAIDRRANAFKQSAWEILISDATNKAELITTSVRQFAGTLEDDIADLMAGRIMKALTDPTDMGKLAGISKIAEGLVGGPISKGGDSMTFDPKTLNEEGKIEFERLAKAAEGAPALQETADANETFWKAAEFAKAHAEYLASDPDNSDPILKAIPENIRPMFKAMRKQVEDLTEKVTQGQTFSKMQRLTTEAAGYAQVLPLETAEIAESLSKAEDSGDESIRKMFKASVEILKAAKLVGDPLGSDMQIGSDDAMVAAQTRVDTMAKARVEASGGTISFEKAYAQVLDENPSLYDDADPNNYELVPTN